MLNQYEIKLIEALRSGVYKQGYGSLRPSNDKFCCLGVACDISSLGYWKQNRSNSDSIYVPTNTDITQEAMNLPNVVMKNLGWSKQYGKLVFVDRGGKSDSLSALNDSEEFTFDQIADIIQAELVEKE